MSTSRKPGFHFNVALCLLAMTALAAAILLWWGLSPFTAILAAIAIACPLAALYAWWLARRALKPLERAGDTDAGMSP